VLEGAEREAVFPKGSGAIREETETVLPYPGKSIRRFERQDTGRD
jgi:hypothetical protein